MKMGPGDYQIYGVGSGHLWVVAGIPTHGLGLASSNYPSWKDLQVFQQ